MRIKFLAVAALALVLTACQRTTTPVVVNLPAPPVPHAQPMVLHDVQWKVYNRAGLRQLLADLEQHPDKDFAIFVLTPKSYQALSLNMIEMERYMDEQGRIIVFLKKTLDQRAQVGHGVQ